MTIFNNDCSDCFHKPVLKNKRWAKVGEVTFIIFFKAYKQSHRDHKNRQGESGHLFPASYNTSNKSLGILTIAFFIIQGIRKIKLNAQQAPSNPPPSSPFAVNASQASRSTSWEAGFISLGALHGVLSSHSTSSTMPTQIAPSKSSLPDPSITWTWFTCIHNSHHCKKWAPLFLSN